MILNDAMERLGSNYGQGILGTPDDEASAAQTTLAVTMLDSADPAQAGVNFLYTLSVRNTGSNTANNILVTVTLDASVTWVSTAGTGWTLGHSGQTVTASIASLAAGATANLITITVTAGGSAGSITSTAATTCNNAPTVNSSQGTTIVVVTKDATSNIYVPSTAQEWQALGLPAPKVLRLCQDASGNLVDALAVQDLTAQGAPTYHNTITGWSRFFVGITQTASQGFYNASIGSGPHPHSDSTAYLLNPAKIEAAGGNRIMWRLAGSNLAWGVANTGHLFITIQNQSNINGSYNYVDGVAHPFGMRYNRATRTISVFTDKEEVTGTWNDVVEADYGLNGSGFTPPQWKVGCDAEWEGEGAERIGTDTLIKLGWSLAYTPNDTGTSIDTHLTDTLDGTRPVIMQVPAGVKYTAKGGTYPLVMILGYYGSTGDNQQSLFGLQALKDADAGYIVLAPTGKLDGSSKNYWNSGNACCGNDGSGGTNDLSYLGSLLDQAIAKWPVDTSRVILIGQSNGAFMALKLACSRADIVTHALALQGSEDYPIPTCSPARAVNIVMYAHTSDPTFLYAGNHGGFNTPYTAPMAGVDETAADWNTKNGGSGSLGSAYDTVDILSSIASTETSRQAYGSPPLNGLVERWTNTAAFHITDPGMFTTNAIKNNFIAWAIARPRV